MTELHQNMADRSIMPMRRDFNELYTEFKNKKYGLRDLSLMFMTLKTKIDEWKENSKDLSMEFSPFDEEKTVHSY